MCEGGGGAVRRHGAIATVDIEKCIIDSLLFAERRRELRSDVPIITSTNRRKSDASHPPT